VPATPGVSGRWKSQVTALLVHRVDGRLQAVANTDQPFTDLSPYLVDADLLCFAARVIMGMHQAANTRPTYYSC